MISKEVVLNKMMKELQAAMKAANNDKEMLKHISNLKLLAELFLDENEKENSDEHIQQPSLSTNQISSTPSISPKVDDQDGTSIFDF